MKKTHFLAVFVLFAAVIAQSQTTAIPDNYFEQALIDLGIDSDGTVNGEVLTADIENVTELDVSDQSIENLTGIADFVALEVLNVMDNYLTSLDVSSNTELKELYCGNIQETWVINPINSIDISNNPNLEVLWAQNLSTLEEVNLKNGNNAILIDVDLTCYVEGEDCESLIDCIQVDDAEAASNGEPPYGMWEVYPVPTYAEDCSLGINETPRLSVAVYPNPTSSTVTIATGSAVLQEVRVHTTTGKEVLRQKHNMSVDLSALAPGVYFLAITTDLGRQVEKVVKD